MENEANPRNSEENLMKKCEENEKCERTQQNSIARFEIRPKYILKTL